MKIHLDTPTEEARIELVPLIDVIFCILTFFLLAALQLTRQQAINVDLPKAKTGQTQMREMLIVSIDDFGQTYIDQLPVNYQQLDRVLKSFQQQNPAGLTVLYAPQNAKYAKVVEVLDRLREVGGDRVALATLPSSAPSPQPNPSLPNSGIPTAPPTGNQVQPLPSQGATPVNPRGSQFQVPSQQPQFNPNQFQSPLPTPSQGVSKSPVSPAPTAPNIEPGVATPSQNVAPQN
ncbi:biopolymer transporter ExbD [Tychonema sp. BBK16]|uniref:ExbD/TolR family protein n=1 Tax=Tychonema sp. BBK16 TaxID=2699888 RepID=UPI001F1AE0AD|nr:biopolymer transporter ExbD [Tychonema sp. BBK16]MCF6374911.1 biopolymer transporter ExbD [Tychonema sp. BBK16]